MEEDIDFTRFKLSWSDTIQVGELLVGVDEVVERLGPLLTDERRERLSQVVEQRSLRVVSVLENIYDRGNVSAAMRSSEAFGFLRMHLIDAPGARFKAANRVTKGAEKWLDVCKHSGPSAAVAELRGQGYQIWATDLAAETTIDALDWTRPLAFVLGNEKDGVTPEMRGLVDGSFRIPMLGFSQSFNISVAAALIFYRAQIEIRERGFGLSAAEKRQVLANYYLRCFDNPEALLRARLNG